VDIAGSALQAARRGVYPASRVRGRLPPGFQSRYFEMLPSGELRVQPVLRALVSFAPLNLSRPFGSLGLFDIIFCRNVVIYFAPELRRSILMQIHDMLNPGGVLILGASEGLYQLTGSLCTIHRGPTTYHRKEG
jgi:chemotaxis protein methyltransferase CheR